MNQTRVLLVDTVPFAKVTDPADETAGLLKTLLRDTRIEYEQLYVDELI